MQVRKNVKRMMRSVMANYAQNKSKNYAEMASLQGDMDKDKPREKELREIRERYRDDY